MQVSLKNIAKELNVSPATVSRALNNTGYVKEDTKNRIIQALIEHGYTKLPASVGEQKVVLIINGDINSQVYVSYMNGISQVLTESGYTVLVGYSNYNALQDEKNLLFAQKNHFSGIIMLSAIETPSLVESLRKSETPFVLVNRYLQSLETDAVGIDDYRTGYMATERLIKAGHHRIAHLAGPVDSITCINRRRGYEAAMTAAGLPIPDHAIFQGDCQYASGVQCGKWLADQDFSAIFSTNDIMAVGIADALSKASISVPDDISIICADNSSETVTGRIHLTAVSYDPVSIGKSAANMLLSRIANPSLPKQQISYAPTVWERDSIAPPSKGKYIDK